MRQRLTTWGACFALIGVMALAEGPSRDLISEAEIPADKTAWNSCCHHLDCHEGRVSAWETAPGWVAVEVNRWPVFPLVRSRVYRSTNGRDYFCRYDITKPPSARNIRCVFLGRSGHAKGESHGDLQGRTDRDARG